MMQPTRSFSYFLPRAASFESARTATLRTLAQHQLSVSSGNIGGGMNRMNVPGNAIGGGSDHQLPDARRSDLDRGGGGGGVVGAAAAEEDWDFYDRIDDEGGDGGDPNPTYLSRLIQQHEWAAALAWVASHPSECKVPGMEGRTPLHMACDQDAPAVVIQALLKAYPEASTIVGTSNMNPLHITCSSQHASVHVVRVLLESGHANQLMMRDVDGDTPLHAACRCSAPMEVLDVLLRACPEAVHVSDLEGLTPLHRIWVRCVVLFGDDVIDCVTSAADLHGGLLEAWNKTELLLRCAYHGTLDRFVPAAPANAVGGQPHPPPGHAPLFRPLHAAAAVDCPRSIVKIASCVYPHQLDELDEQGRTPLMIACQAPVYPVRDLSDEGYTLEDVIHGDENNLSNGVRSSQADLLLSSESSNDKRHQPSVIEILLQANQETATMAACVHDVAGRLPLHLALTTGKQWHEGVKKLVNVYPDALLMPDTTTGLYAYMLAATQGNLDTTYHLLRLNPEVAVAVSSSSMSSSSAAAGPQPPSSSLCFHIGKVEKPIIATAASRFSTDSALNMTHPEFLSGLDPSLL